MKDLLRYDRMVETALRGVVREALARAAASGLPGTHHFYITFKTRFPGVAIPDSLLADYPEEMTIVLEHQFWELEVEEQRFAVTLSFKNKPERVSVPFEAVTAFTDPSVKFGLQFQPGDVAATPTPALVAKPAEEKKADKGAKADKADKNAKTAEVVTLDSFRKK